MVNLIVGILFIGLLFYLEFSSQKLKAFLPFGVALAFAIVFIEITIVFIGLTMPGYSTTMSITGIGH